MKLSDKQLHYIQREFRKKRPETIARALKVDPAAVGQAVRRFQLEQGSEPVTVLLRASWIILLITLFCLPWGYWEFFYQNNMQPKRLILYAGVSMALILWLAAWFRSGAWKIRISILTLFPGVLVIWAMLSAIWAHNAYEALQQSIYWLFCYLLFFLLTQLLESGARVRQLLITLFISGISLCLLGIFQHFSWIGFYYQEISPAATFVNKNMAAQFALLILPAGIYLWLNYWDRKINWLITLGLCLCCAFIFYTRTRAVWLASFIFCLYLLGVFLVYWRRRVLGNSFFKPLFLRSFPALFFLVLLMHLGPHGWQSIPSQLQRKTPSIKKIATNEQTRSNPAETAISKPPKGTTIGSRIIWLQNSTQLFARHWLLGVGVFNFQIYYPLTMMDGPHDHEANLFSHLLQVHNDWMQLSVELGIPFILIAGGILIILGRWFWVVLLEKSKSGITGFPMEFLIATGALAALGLNALFSFPLYQAVPPAMMALYASVLVFGMMDFKKTETAEIRIRDWIMPAPFWVRCIILSLLAGLLAGNLNWQYHWSMADHNFNLLRSALDMKHYDAMIIYADRVIAHNPDFGSAYEVKARALMEKGKLEEALSEFRKARKQFPYATLIMYGQARCQFKSGHYEDALKTIDDALKVIPYAVELYSLQGQVYQELNKPEAAYSSYRQACELNPRAVEHYITFGIAAIRLERYEEALDAFQQAIEVDPQSGRAMEWIGLVKIFVFREFTDGTRYLKKSLTRHLKPADEATVKKILTDIENGVLRESIVRPEMLNIK